jgi:hypothetical protein
MELAAGKYAVYSYCSAARGGARVQTGGLNTWLRAAFYPRYNDRKRKRSRKTKLCGSSKKRGIRVDHEFVGIVASGGAPPRQLTSDAMTRQLWSHIVGGLGHAVEAAQLPVEVPHAQRMTQADLITRDPATGRLWLWEIKTGYPIGATRKQGHLPVRNSRTGDYVDCTKFNIWQLQLHYTRQALEAAGVPIAESRVLQVYVPDRNQRHRYEVVEHTPPEWTKGLPPPGATLPKLPADFCNRMTPAPKKKRKRRQQ